MQCKDIPDIPILVFLNERRTENKGWANINDGFESSIGQAMPAGIPKKLRRAKCAQLIKRKLISGCTCGCRGDFEITEKGIEYISKESVTV